MKKINKKEALEQKKFEIFYNLLIETNKKFNLTTITNKDEVYEKHFLDSIEAVDLIKENSTVLDVGAGAGFPSIPLAILRNDCNFTLIDSLNKRVSFLNTVKTSLNLNNISPIHSRIEDFLVTQALEINCSKTNEILQKNKKEPKNLNNPLKCLKSNYKKQNNREKFDYVLARAVAPLPILLEYCAQFAKIGGKIIAYKGSGYMEELEQSQNAISVLGLKLEEICKYSLEKCAQDRFLLVFSKSKHTPMEFPRKNNKPRIQPL